MEHIYDEHGVCFECDAEKPAYAAQHKIARLENMMINTMWANRENLENAEWSAVVKALDEAERILIKITHCNR